MKNIEKVHEKILQILLDYRKNYSDFTFQLRQKPPKRLIEGKWFTGNENYIFVGFYKVGCKDNKTKTMGFVCVEDVQYFEIVYRNIAGITKNEEDFYLEVIEFLKELPFKQIEQKDERKVWFYFQNNDLEKNLLYTLDNIKPKIDELLRKYNLWERYVSSDEEFIKMLNKIENYKNNQQVREEVVQVKTKNIILYGPPGVGKTHNYQRLISMIESAEDEKTIFDVVTNNESSEAVELNQELYKEIEKQKRVEFITFHQSYSYEDFIEGFRPTEDGNIKLEDGIFKILAQKALNNQKAAQQKHITFDEAYDILRTRFIENELEQLQTVRGINIIINEFADRFLKVISEGAKNEQYIKKSDLESVTEAILQNQVQKPVDIKNLNVKKDTISLAGYYFPIGNMIASIMSQNNSHVEEQNYYIVIDEINRGNISKIFGELITLIEEDKRDFYAVTLPYSKEKFIAPSNLYIIATMNSTDKSIATIDIALRRRFTFLKMQPNAHLVVNEEAKRLMLYLNEYIEKRLGKDFLLGHSYFMGENLDLEFIKEYKIRPLLEEYFYSDDSLDIDKLLYGVEDVL